MDCLNDTPFDVDVVVKMESEILKNGNYPENYEEEFEKWYEKVFKLRT